MSRGMGALSKDDQRAVREWLRLRDLARQVRDPDMADMRAVWGALALGFTLGVAVAWAVLRG